MLTMKSFLTHIFLMTVAAHAADLLGAESWQGAVEKAEKVLRQSCGEEQLRTGSHHTFASVTVPAGNRILVVGVVSTGQGIDTWSWASGAGMRFSSGGSECG